MTHGAATVSLDFEEKELPGLPPSSGLNALNRGTGNSGTVGNSVTEPTSLRNNDGSSATNTHHHQQQGVDEDSGPGIGMAAIMGGAAAGLVVIGLALFVLAKSGCGMDHDEDDMVDGKKEEHHADLSETEGVSESHGSDSHFDEEGNDDLEAYQQAWF